LGDVCEIRSPRTGDAWPAEVVGFRDNRVLLMPLSRLDGLQPGCEVVALHRAAQAPAGVNLVGRILDGMGEPIDGHGPLLNTSETPLRQTPPHPLRRRRVEEPMGTGVKAIDAFVPLARGQRLGIFAGSGVGKSTLLGMIARTAEAEVNVIALVGERGRELREFIERDLGEEGLKRSVVVVATSDQPALVRLRAALLATAIAESFRDAGKDVLLMMDSVTRFAMAQREVGLAAGEPPTTRGYPPSVFAMLPQLLERTGMGETGSITALYTVLVEGGDFDEPISDAVRGILDGHMVLSRSLAAANHYPAIDVLESISRLQTAICTPPQLRLLARARDLLALYRRHEEVIAIGAYVRGSQPAVDQAIDKHPALIAFLRQGMEERWPRERVFQELERILA
jgi:flagellum-specific ATP synthase